MTGAPLLITKSLFLASSKFDLSTFAEALASLQEVKKPNEITKLKKILCKNTNL
jgi:hypothetical protein